MTLPELRHAIAALATKIEEMGQSAIAGTITFPEAKAMIDTAEIDLFALQAEYAVKSRYNETKAERIAELGGIADANSAGVGVNGETLELKAAGLTLGDQWVQSSAYKNMIVKGFTGNWQSDSFELKTTLGEASSAPGYGLVQTPTVLPGVLQTLFAPLMVADLIPSGSLSGPNLRYITESAVTNAAATVAESGTKPLSDLTFAIVDDRLRKLATLMQVTNEMLEDVAFIVSYINSRLALFINILRENQVLLGDGTGENLTGIMNRSGKQTNIVKGTAPSLAGDNDMDVVLRMITNVRINSFLEPDAIVTDPATWQTMQLGKASTAGTYLAGGPWGSTPPTLWGKPVVVTPRMTAGNALIGAFGQATQLFSRGGIVIDSSNSHSTNFAINQTTMRAEERLLLAVYRPGAFGICTGL